MIKIQIAGAGAGKTFGLATMIKRRMEENSNGKTVYALTYTNAAKNKIHAEVVRQCGGVPQNLHIETVHSFLLNAIIFPFSSYVTKQKYHAASIEGLSADVKWKNLRINVLKKANIVHTDVVYKVARAILNRDSTNNKTKAQKAKVDHVLSIVSACTDSIFVDEVQDLDADALAIFRMLATQDCLVNLIGDPKQAIKHPKAFQEFVTEVDGQPGVEMLEANNTTRRIPQSILLHSNRFCYPKQEQKTISTKVGSISYIESTDQDFHPFLMRHIKAGTIVYIDKRSGPYGTHAEEKYGFPFEVAKLIGAARPDRDPDLHTKAAFIDFTRYVRKSGSMAVRLFLKEYGIAVDQKVYAKLSELSDKLNHQPASYNVKSIDAIKGLEAETCIFILSKTSLDYFLQDDLAKEKRFNKEWKRVYVALTRSQDALHLVLDHTILAKEDVHRAKCAFQKYGIDKHACNP
jgi:hypothetical protein